MILTTSAHLHLQHPSMPYVASIITNPIPSPPHKTAIQMLQQRYTVPHERTPNHRWTELIIWVS